MSDLKSKLPSMDELVNMGSKLFGDVKKSVGEIVDSYKEHRKHDDSEQSNENEKEDKQAPSDRS